MTGRTLWETATAMAVLIVMVSSYPHGAPDSACTTLIPDSHGASSATGPSPYILRFSSTTYSPNQVIAVQLVGAAHKGYLIVGRRADGSSSDPVGFFQQPGLVSRLACATGSTGNGITQTNNTVKTTSSFLWKAPSASVGIINFDFTVIRGGAPNTKPDASDYYANERSGPLTPAGFHDDQIEKNMLYENELSSLMFSNVEDRKEEAIEARENKKRKEEAIEAREEKKRKEEAIKALEENENRYEGFSFAQIIYRSNPYKT